MTVIMGIKRAGEIWIGSDRRIGFGDYVMDPPESVDSKLVYLDHAIIGAAGDITMRNYLELFVSKSDNREYVFDTKLSVIEFFIHFKKFLKRHAGLGGSDSGQVQIMGNSDWIIATKDKLFELNEDGGIMELDDICAIGCGQIVARTTLEYMFEYQPELDPATMLGRAHSHVVRRVSGCGGTQIVVNATAKLTPAPITPAVE